MTKKTQPSRRFSRHDRITVLDAHEARVTVSVKSRLPDGYVVTTSTGQVLFIGDDRVVGLA